MLIHFENFYLIFNLFKFIFYTCTYMFLRHDQNYINSNTGENY